VDYYQEIASDYDKWFLTPMHVVMDREEKEAVRKWIKQSRVVLDVGCGTGRMTSFLSEMGFEVVGVDISKSMLDVAKSRVAGADLVRATANALPFVDKSFDTNVSIWGCLCHVEDPYFAIGEIVRVTKKKLIFSIYGNIAYKVLLRITALIRNPQNALRYVQGSGSVQVPARYYAIREFLDNLPKNVKLVEFLGINLVPMLLPNIIGRKSSLITLFQDLDRIMLKIPFLRYGASSFLVVAEVLG
jgi:SAM-dependent methyltransferase